MARPGFVQANGHGGAGNHRPRFFAGALVGWTRQNYGTQIMSLGIGLETLRGAGNSWRAGSVYYADLLYALRASFPNEVRLLLVEALHGTPVPDELVPLADDIVAYPHLKRHSPTWAINHAQNRLLK